jgi:hypothetical protein
MAKKIFTGDVGVLLRVFANTDLTTATSLSFEVKKPNGTIVNWTAILDSSNSYYAKYTTQTDDLDVDGDWCLSLEAVFPGGISIKGASAHFTVYNQFDDCEE